MCSKVLNGHIILTDTSITTILAPEMTYTPIMQPEYMTKQANDDLIVITRKKLIELMNLQCRMRYMLTLLGAICCKKKLEFMMMPQDVCDFLKIDYKTFEKTLSKVAPKCTFWQGGKVYTLEQMVNVAEIATRPQRLKKILPPTK